MCSLALSLGQARSAASLLFLRYIPNLMHASKEIA